MTKVSLITDYDVYLFKEGSHTKLYRKLGAHLVEGGVYFAVWAPNAREVSVIGDFNGWDPHKHPMRRREDPSGIWETFVPNLPKGTRYKYFLVDAWGNPKEKSDPFAFFWEPPPSTACLVWDLDYHWNDQVWMATRRSKNSREAPISIYELHVGSWKKGLSYRDLAHELSQYVTEIGFTHVELMPVMEHPFYGSWGYQITGYFAPTSRYGTPQDFMYLIDLLHQKGIGVILDWVPSHFPTDPHGLAFFDGTCLYEYEDWRLRWHPDWNSHVFDYSKGEVRSFLLSSAHFWLDLYHVDGLRVDAVASMLYLDYSRSEWKPNVYGGRENLEAIEFLKKLNTTVYAQFPDVQTYAEESTAWPMVSRPVYLGGLGFGFKWNMGWMNDTLFYFSLDPIYRKYHHGILTFNTWYAFSENFVLPLSHDEVVHGKGSLLQKMWGDVWQKFAHLRLLLAYMYAFPGKKLLFMGNEIAQWEEWNHESSLRWDLLEYPSHRGIKKLVEDLNRLYREEKALHQLDCEAEGFEWVDFHDWEQSVISFLRKSKEGEVILCVFNFTPVVRYRYRVGAPAGGTWREILNTDSEIYWGSNVGNMGKVEAQPVVFHSRPYSLELTLPPLGAIFLKKAF
ncbi:1,4-alpha-glucan branching enzyme [Thermocrinis albus DSM 14484]|uniref:1,4-alpha-glucan branching enzyme GlgB n=1 Tax=Thermocrinis albus (strain DSM 14484 / JCM 11386 / HI 11/12) TaxID=638303 RepID=D3SND0_THEAH|nr:1,4-alpha-glucan branching protein GlgB [Thermocrinis albus]ADC88667.1 1,4-alpha-glucan branching enzyme [Thermocrinis albus DSM 14484]